MLLCFTRTASAVLCFHQEPEGQYRNIKAPKLPSYAEQAPCRVILTHLGSEEERAKEKTSRTPVSITTNHLLKQINKQKINQNSTALVSPLLNEHTHNTDVVIFSSPSGLRKLAFFFFFFSQFQHKDGQHL